MAFCTAINCIDGRVQLPVIEHLRERVGVPYVTMITAPGAVGVMAADGPQERRDAILSDLAVSVEVHSPRILAVVAHADCAGNPFDEQHQLRQLEEACDLVSDRHPSIPVLGLWVSESGTVAEVCTRLPG